VYHIAKADMSIEAFALGQNYSIKYNNSDKNVEIYNIISKVIGDKVSGLKFNGSSSFLKIPDSNLDKYTLTFLAYFENANIKQSLVESGWRLTVENGMLNINYKNETLSLEKEIQTKEYIQIAIKKDGNTLTIFFDGIQSSKLFTSKIENKDIIMGKSFEGVIGEIALFSEIKTTEDLCDMYDSCDLRGCSFIPSGATRNECYQTCMDSGCDAEACSNKCYNKDTSRWKPPCEFKPYGSDIFSCMNHCNTKNSCNYGDCQKLCQECTNPDTCPWIITPDSGPEPNPYTPPSLYDPEGKPMAPKIKVTPYNGKLMIAWDKSVQPNTEPVLSYVCVMFKTLNKTEGVNLSMVPYPTCSKCSFVVDNLNEDEFYSVGIRAYNNKGLGRISNIVSMQPKFKKNPPTAPMATSAPAQVTQTHFCNAKN
jgi:hypothetical protein